MKEKPQDTNRDSKIGRILDRITKKLEGSHKIDKSSIRSNEETVQQKKKKSARTESWRQHVVRSQEYPFEQTLKEVRPKKIWTIIATTRYKVQ